MPEVEIDFSLPKWLDQLFIEKSLKSFLKDESVQVRTVDFESVTGKGENFASFMYRARVTFSVGENGFIRPFSCVIKCAYESGFGYDLLSPCNVYPKEFEMYQIILPKIKAVLASVKIKNDLFPNTIYGHRKNYSIVLEDLALKGYRMPSRCNGLDARHAKMLLNKLAKFHAATAVLQSKQPDIFKNFQQGIISRNGTFAPFYAQSLNSLIELISQWPNYQHYVEKLKNLRPHLIENACKCFDPKPNQFNALSHGDIWSNNSMFAYNAENEPEKIMLIDFQFCCWSSPAIDLHYFLNTSLVEDLRLYYQDELIQYYHKILTRTLKTLSFAGYIPSLLEFNIQLMENSFYAFVSSLLVQPIMINDKGGDIDVSHLHTVSEKSMEYRKLIYSNEKVQQNIKALLPVFDRKGLLDLC